MGYSYTRSIVPPSSVTARFASSISSPAIAPFIARNAPPTFTYGRQSSARMFSRATARDVAISYCSRQVRTNSSARAVTTSASTPSCGRISRSHVMRLARESRSVSSIDGSAIFSGTPGKPAPQPMSITRFPEKSSACKSAMQSRKCSSATACGSVIAVRFMTRFFSISACPNAQSVSICSGGRPERASSVALICPPFGCTARRGFPARSGC